MNWIGVNATGKMECILVNHEETHLGSETRDIHSVLKSVRDGDERQLQFLVSTREIDE